MGVQLFLLLLLVLKPCTSLSLQSHRLTNQALFARKSLKLSIQTHPTKESKINIRRHFLRSIVGGTAAIVSVPSSSVLATDQSPTATVEMKTFVDPKGLFAINVPKRFFAIRRTVKGDLPDEKTGKGRRGSSIFTAGDLAKAEVIAIERFPTFTLLEDEGIIVEPGADLTTFPKIGDAIAIANLIAIKRDKDKPGQARTLVIPDSVLLSDDGKTLSFSLSSNIEVQKPELLFEQEGISELVRITLAKATLNSNDGQLMAVFASALRQDFKGDDGVALMESVDTFVASDRSIQ